MSEEKGQEILSFDEKNSQLDDRVDQKNFELSQKSLQNEIKEEEVGQKLELTKESDPNEESLGNDAKSLNASEKSLENEVDIQVTEEVVQQNFEPINDSTGDPLKIENEDKIYDANEKPLNNDVKLTEELVQQNSRFDNESLANENKVCPPEQVNQLLSNLYDVPKPVVRVNQPIDQQNYDPYTPFNGGESHQQNMAQNPNNHHHVHFNKRMSQPHVITSCGRMNRQSISQERHVKSLVGAHEQAEVVGWVTLICSICLFVKLSGDLSNFYGLKATKDYTLVFVVYLTFIFVVNLVYFFASASVLIGVKTAKPIYYEFYIYITYFFLVLAPIVTLISIFTLKDKDSNQERYALYPKTPEKEDTFDSTPIGIIITTVFCVTGVVFYCGLFVALRILLNSKELFKQQKETHQNQVRTSIA